MAVNERVLQIVIRAKNEASKVLKGAGDDMTGFQKGLGAAGLAVTGAGLAGAAALDKMANSAAAYGSKVVMVQRLTGGTAEESSKFAAVLDRYGIEGKSVGTMFKSLGAAIAGNAKELKNAGIATQDVTGKNRSQVAVLRDLAEYYQNATDKTAAVAVVSKVLGKNWMTLLPALSGGAEAFDSIAKKAEDAGLIMNQEGVDSVKNLSAATKDLEAKEKGLELQFGLMVIPLKTLVVEYLGKAFEWFQKLSPETKQWAGYIAIVGTGAALVIGPLMTLISTMAAVRTSMALTSLATQGASASMIGPAGLVVAAAAAGFAIGSLITQIPGVKAKLVEFGNYLQKTWGLGGDGKATTALGNTSDKIGQLWKKANASGDWTEYDAYLKSLPKRAAGGFFSAPHVGIVGDSAGGEWWVPNNAGGMGVLAAANAAMGGGAGGRQVVEARVFLDGRELSRGLGRTTADSARTGVR